MLSPSQDAFGRALLDYQQDKGRRLAFERDDGYIDCSEGVGQYFAGFGSWPKEDRQAMRRVRGRVLDVGCGAGRHCLYFQERGFDMVGIDNSPLAVKVCRMRGVRKAMVMSAADVCTRRLPELGGRFDTITMMGNNLGLLGSAQRARRMLKRFRGITNPGAHILGSTLDPYDTDRPEHRASHRRNRQRGRMGGQARIRVRYGLLKTPWFDYLFVSRRELARLLDRSGWRLARTLDGSGNRYVAMIVRTD